MADFSSSQTPATPPQRVSSKEACPPGCTDCLKGGLPLKKELTSFLFLLFFTLSLILGVLFIQAKRDVIALEGFKAAPAAEKAQPSPTPSYPKPKARSYSSPIVLPKPQTRGTLSVEAALAARRSRRTYTQVPVTLPELSQMLWAGQGITEPVTGKRTAPSAREGYPFTIFVVVRNVAGLDDGLYEYLPKEHALGNLSKNDAGEKLTSAGVQAGAQESPVVFLLSAAHGKGVEKMGAGVVNSSLMEAGHIGQNLYLEAESMKMGTVAMAGFDSKKVGQALELDPAESVLYIFPFGNPAPEKIEE